MAVHFILDGYNIIQQSSDLALGSLQEGRQRLIRWIEVYRPQGSTRNSVTVVFDGQRNISHPPRDSFVRVIFTQGDSADNKIKHLVSRAQNKRSQIVVTNDRDIRHYVRALGAGVMAAQEFLARMSCDREEGRGTPPAAMHHASKGISRVLEHEITREMKAVWLRESG